ncbi:MAG: transposase [Thermoplasmatales archaeon]|nr:transposase [Thermoplasmatales archaeon]MCW6170884.1 transposase [Thermoplasmatales archaeon]
MFNAYDAVIMEDLNVTGMMKNHNLARSISDAGWSSFMIMLKTKAMLRGKNIIEIGRFDPSSKMCSKCGNIKHDLKLSDRTYHCNECDPIIDRDLNAAINIKKFGLIQIGVPTDSGGSYAYGDISRGMPDS